MKFSPEETEFLALLVHRGFIGEADARELFAQEGEESPLLAVLADRGLLAADEARRLFRNKVGERPRLTRYEIKGRLGEGKTALVFKALDRRDQQVLALKILREELAANPLKLERFIEEADAREQAQHETAHSALRRARERRREASLQARHSRPPVLGLMYKFGPEYGCPLGQCVLSPWKRLSSRPRFTMSSMLF